MFGFWVDTVTLLPIQSISNKLLFLQLLRFRKIFKAGNTISDLLTRFFSMFFYSSLGISTYRLTNKLLKLVIKTLLTIHLLALLLILLSFHTDEELLNTQDVSNQTLYSNAIYLAVVNVTTVGFGDIVPTQASSQIFFICLLLYSILLYSNFFQESKNFVKTIESIRNYKQLMAQDLDDWLMRLQIARGGSDSRVLGYVRESITNHKDFNQLRFYFNDFFPKIPGSFQKELTIEFRDKILITFSSFFKGLDDKLTQFLLSSIIPRV